DCLRMVQLMLSHVEVRDNILHDEKYRFLFSVEEVNKLVLSGVPFRDAYKKVGAAIASGNYNPERTVTHTHEGSIGNLCLGDVQRNMENVLNSFGFNRYRRAIALLLKRA